MTADAPRRLGVEEELLLIGPRHGLVPAGDAVSARAAEVDHEFKLEQVEIESAPTADLTDVADQLRAARHRAAEAAAASGARVAALALSPFPARPHQTPEPRYERMATEYGHVAAEQLSCGQHVHVEVASRADGVTALDGIRDWLPVLRAIAGGSPFWQGRDTGYASFRTIVWGQWPTAGPADAFGSEAAYDAAVADLIGTGAALDPGMIYFDARLSARYPTVEIRVADVAPRLTDSVAVAALCRALVHTAVAVGRGSTTRVDALRAATWRAARHGLGDGLVDPRTGQVADAWTVLDGLLEHVQPALELAGDTATVQAALRRWRRDGTAAERHRAAGGPAAVIDLAVAETLAD